MDHTILRNNIDSFLSEYFLSRIITRGENYFINGKVRMIERDGTTFTALVSGSKDYTVEVDVEQLEYCHCDCPFDDWCKHIVAVLLEIKNNGETLTENPLLINGVFDTENWDETLDDLQIQIQPYVEKLNDILTLNFPLRRQRLANLLDQLTTNLAEVRSNSHEQLILLSYILLIDGLTKQATNYDTYHYKKVHFDFLFNEIVTKSSPLMQHEVEQKHQPFYEMYTKKLMTSSQRGKFTFVYKRLLSKWLSMEDSQSELINHSEQLLLHADTDKLFFLRLASFLYLKANNGARSIALLKKIKHIMSDDDLLEHFSYMKQQKDWEMMKHWFQLLLPEKPNSKSQLRKIYHEMIVETGSEEEKLNIVWKEWLNDPSFFQYEKKMRKTPEEEKENVLAYILPKLEKDLYRLSTEATYFQIMRNEKRFERGMLSLLMYKKDPTTLTPEIKSFLKSVKKTDGHLLLPFYHQIVERLVNKKSRVHYIEAADYIRQLRTVYQTQKKQELFKQYINGLKQRYKTYRAFIQELNSIESI